MRRFLYMTPFFPPLRRVGAIAPLKIARHLPALGWMPVVLADMWPGAPVDDSLEALVPEDVVVDRSYSGRSGEGWRPDSRQGNEPVSMPPGLLSRMSGWFARRDYLPLGDYRAFQRHALARGRELLRQHACELIVAQSTPVAALVAGAALSRETGLPLVTLFADPWRACELRNPIRPPHTRLANALHEGRVVAASSRVLLYTERSRDDYRRLYPNEPAEKFVDFHNGFDAAMQDQPWNGELPSPSMLFFGSFGHVVKATAAVRLLAALARRGGLAARITLVTTDSPAAADLALARRLGVADRITVIGRVPYRMAQSVMEKAGILLEINATPQRIVAKTYDYLQSDRPILSIGDEHPQLRRMLEETGAGRCFEPGQEQAMADFVLTCFSQGMHPHFPRKRPEIEKYAFAVSACQVAEAFDAALGLR